MHDLLLPPNCCNIPLRAFVSCTPKSLATNINRLSSANICRILGLHDGCFTAMQAEESPPGMVQRKSITWGGYHYLAPSIFRYDAANCTLHNARYDVPAPVTPLFYTGVLQGRRLGYSSIRKDPSPQSHTPHVTPLLPHLSPARSFFQTKKAPSTETSCQNTNNKRVTIASFEIPSPIIYRTHVCRLPGKAVDHVDQHEGKLSVTTNTRTLILRACLINSRTNINITEAHRHTNKQ